MNYLAMAKDRSCCLVWFGEEVVWDAPLGALVHPKGLGADDEEEAPVEPPPLPQLSYNIKGTVSGDRMSERRLNLVIY